MRYREVTNEALRVPGAGNRKPIRSLARHDQGYFAAAARYAPFEVSYFENDDDDARVLKRVITAQMLWDKAMELAMSLYHMTPNEAAHILNSDIGAAVMSASEGYHHGVYVLESGDEIEDYDRVDDAVELGLRRMHQTITHRLEQIRST